MIAPLGTARAPHAQGGPSCCRSGKRPDAVRNSLPIRLQRKVIAPPRPELRSNRLHPAFRAFPQSELEIPPLGIAAGLREEQASPRPQAHPKPERKPRSRGLAEGADAGNRLPVLWLPEGPTWPN